MEPDAKSARLHHVGIIVPNRERVDMLVDLLGLHVRFSQYVEEYEADCVFTGAGGPYLEFIVPRGGKLSEFNNGLGGLHHIAIEVKDLAAHAKQLQAKGIRLLEQKSVNAGEMRINFLPPVYTRGIIVEFVEVGPSSGGDARTSSDGKD
jgi:methylmalonyl-CoA/ethylmalonyl-CoA epimerase